MNTRNRRSVRWVIGNFAVSVRSAFDQVLKDFAAIYQGYTDDGDLMTIPVRMEVRRGGRSLLGRSRYTVCSEGEDIYVGCRANEVLPCLEWGINWRVITGCPEYLQLHAAALVRNGQGVVVAGPSGSGKSTLTAALLSRGWTYLSDEIAMIEPETLTLRGFPKALCIKGGAFELMRSLKAPLWRRRHWVKAAKGPVGYVNPRQVRAESVGDLAPIGFVVYLRHQFREASRFVPISPAQAVFALTALTLNRDAFGPRLTPLLVAVARGAHCVALDSGPLAQTCELLEQLVEGQPVEG